MPPVTLVARTRFLMDILFKRHTALRNIVDIEQITLLLSSKRLQKHPTNAIRHSALPTHTFILLLVSPSFLEQAAILT